MADGRAYFGFGASSGGTLSLVASPTSGQLMLEDNASYGGTILATVGQTYQANHWYRLEVTWGSGGSLIGRLYDSNGTTVLSTVTATDARIASGGIAFRATGSYDKQWDTITASRNASQASAPADRTPATAPQAAVVGNATSSRAATEAATLPAIQATSGHFPSAVDVDELFAAAARALRRASDDGLESWFKV